MPVFTPLFCSGLGPSVPDKKNRAFCFLHDLLRNLSHEPLEQSRFAVGRHHNQIDTVFILLFENFRHSITLPDIADHFDLLAFGKFGQFLLHHLLSPKDFRRRSCLTADASGT